MSDMYEMSDVVHLDFKEKVKKVLKNKGWLAQSICNHLFKSTCTNICQYICLNKIGIKSHFTVENKIKIIIETPADNNSFAVNVT